MTPHEFIRKWKPVALTERQTAQEHFLDLCRLVGHPTPVEEDPSGQNYCFEKGALKSSGNPGFADVWKKGYFAFEYKKKKKNLGEALKQLSQYAWNLENPPLNVVCDTNAIRIVTAWTNTPSKTFDLTLDNLADPEKFAILHAVFYDPEKLRGHMTREMLTKDAADKFSGLAQRFQSRGHLPEAVAHFVMQLVFCFFAEDVKLLPEGFFRKALSQLNIGNRYQHAKSLLDEIFHAMTAGGRVGNEFVAYFNGGLFDGQKALPLEEGDLGMLVAVGSMQWAEIDPSIFGSLFERFLDPAKRAQIGAHYTDAKKILQIVDPVIMRPLNAEWGEVRGRIEKLTATARAKGPRAKEWGQADAERARFVERLASLRILDPACGSGNFLYLALQRVKDLEFRVDNECEKLGLKSTTPRVGPEILFGIEINRLAAEVARTAIWIGDIQWSLRHALYTRPEPVLRKLDQIECRDAVLDRRPDGSFGEAQWPEVDFIIGNPPFLGTKKMLKGLGQDYTKALRAAYEGRVSPFSDLVCWWFEKARAAIVAGKAKRAGLVATNSIRGGKNRLVLDLISKELSIFEAWSDEPWVIDGAAVRVSLVCFDKLEQANFLNGKEVSTISSSLSESAADLTKAIALTENKGAAFVGIQKTGPFDVPGVLARSWITLPLNPNGRPNSDVVRPYWNGEDLTTRPRDLWLLDFPLGSTREEISLYEAPFSYANEHIRPTRVGKREARANERWWEQYWPRPELRARIRNVRRYIVTPETPTHILFVWLSSGVLPDKNLIAIPRDDDTTFGILHSSYHVLWARSLGSPYGNHPTARRYNSSRTFETFPFPEGLTPNIPAADYAADSRAIRIAKAAKRLDDLRNAWLNPPDLIKIEPEVVPGYPDRILPKDADAAKKLKERTLTNLYNQRPQWLADAHEALAN
jgi:type II restriction/modification system DNA methylase subunit YeeA